MDILLFVPIGLGVGAVYALIALGVVLVYRTSGVLNFSAGAVGVVGTYVFIGLQDIGWPTFPAIAVGVIAGAAIGAATQLFVMSRLRQASAVVRLIATLGVLTIIVGFASIFWGSEQPNVNPILPQSVIHISTGLAIGWDRITLFLVAVGVAVVLKLIYAKTTFGMATTAVSENREAASALGWSSGTIELVNWTVGGALSAFAAIMISPLIGVSIEGLTLLVVPALAAALIGGFSSFLLTTAGAMIIGIAQSEAARFVTTPGFSDSVPFLVIVLIVVLGGRARPSRQDLPVRLPLPGSGRIPVRGLIAVIVVAELLVFTVSVGYVDAITGTAATAVLILSVVVLTGYAGQVSLGQWAIAGFGAWVAGRLVASTHMSFGLAVLCALAASIGAGVLIALPALRTRGVNLAIVTLGMALAIEDLILGNGNLTGGVNGTVVAAPHIFGIDLDPIAHPSAYATFSIVVLLICGLLVSNLRRGRTGRRLISVRSDENVAASLGVSVYGAKIYAFAIASFLAALAGILTAFETPVIVYSQFDLFGSINALVYAVIGGIGWISGAIFGSANAPGSVVPQVFQQVLSGGGNTVLEWFTLLAGAGTIVILVKAPQGLAALTLAGLRDVRDKVFTRPDGFRTSMSRSSSDRKRYASSSRGRNPAGPISTRSPGRVEIRQLTVRFGGVVALNDVSFSIEPGEVLGLIGPNGAGKTTLIDAVSGFTKASAGSILLDGEAITRWSPVKRARAGLGRSFQRVALYEELSVWDNLLAAADEHRKTDYLYDLLRPSRRLDLQRVERIVDSFGLESVLDVRPPELPQGTARRVGVARALVAAPTVLFLDEPAAGLDSSDRSELEQMVRWVAKTEGISVVLVEHDVPLVLRACDRIVVLNFGSKIAEGSPAEIQDNPEVRAAYLGQASVEAVVSSSGTSQ